MPAILRSGDTGAMRHLQADRCGLPRSWRLSYEMQGKQSQKFPPPSPFSKIYLGYERHIHLLPQGSPARAHTCQVSLHGNTHSHRGLFYPGRTPTFHPLASGLIQLNWCLPPLTYASLHMVFPGFCGGCHNMVVAFFGIRSN